MVHVPCACSLVWKSACLLGKMQKTPLYEVPGLKFCLRHCCANGILCFSGEALLYITEESSCSFLLFDIG